MYINHPDSDNGNLIIAYATLDVMLNVPLVRPYSQKYPNPHLQFINILFNV